MKMDEETRGFKDWYDLLKTMNRLSDDPYDLRHQYDYRAAYAAGAKLGPTGHLPSRFKGLGHPTRFMDGIDTATGETAKPKDILKGMQIQELLKKMYGDE